MTDVGDLIDDIKALPHFREFSCTQCGESIRVHALQLYANCAACGTQQKCRSFGGLGTELEDVIDAVLEWAGKGENFDAVMKRREEILSDDD